MDELNFERLRKIYIEKGEIGLEEEKERILQNYISQLPQEKQEKAKEFNEKIRRNFVGLDAMERLSKLAYLMADSMFSLSDALVDLKYAVDESVAEKMAIGAIQKAKKS
jgi:hypothetical protein